MKLTLNDVDLERRFLAECASASVAESPEAVRNALGIVGATSEWFTDENARLVFRYVSEAVHEGRPAGVMELEHELKQAGDWPKASWLIQAQAAAMFGTASITTWAKTLRDLTNRRQLDALARDLAFRASDGDHEPLSTLQHLSAQTGRIVLGAERRSRRLSEKMQNVADEMARVGTEADAVLKTGIELWDKNVGGLFPTLTVIGGHPSRGKSGLAATMILKMAMAGLRPAIFTLEDTAEWLIYRFLGHLARVPTFKMRSRPLDEGETAAVGSAWARAEQIADRVYFDERSRPTPLEVLTGAREMILRDDVSCVFIDHAGELNYEMKRGGDRHDLDVADGLLDLRALAKDHKKPVILLSHLSRGKKAPHTMEDFANSAAIERAARVAAIVWTNDGKPLDPFVSIVKNTFGKRDLDLQFELDPVSALVDEPLPEAPQPTGQESLL